MQQIQRVCNRRDGQRRADESPGRGQLKIFDKPIMLRTNGVRLATYEQGEGEPVILLHGFPELAFSWRYQLPALADAGFRAIAIDQRGYGRSDCPTDVSAYTIQALVSDIDGLLDALGVDSARFVAHDWGAIVLWQYALMRADRVEAMAILNIPFYPRPPADPIAIFRRRFGDDFYIVNFQDSDEADRVFADDPRRFLNNMMRSRQITRDVFERLPDKRRTISLLATAARERAGGRALLSDAELDYFVAAFERTGFSGGINWYRNMTHNWESTAQLPQKVTPRTLFIGARDDVVIPLEHIDAMRAHVTELRIEMLSPCGHWSQQERPDDVNQLLTEFFRE